MRTSGAWAMVPPLVPSGRRIGTRTARVRSPRMVRLAWGDGTGSPRFAVAMSAPDLQLTLVQVGEGASLPGGDDDRLGRKAHPVVREIGPDGFLRLGPRSAKLRGRERWHDGRERLGLLEAERQEILPSEGSLDAEAEHALGDRCPASLRYQAR